MPVPEPDRDGERFTAAARFHDYRYASNPLADGGVPPLPRAEWSADLHERGPTRILPLDLSAALVCPPPATTPALCANFIHICPGDGLITTANATSQLFFVMRGGGTTRLDSGGEMVWQAGDLFTLPAGGRATRRSTGSTTSRCCGISGSRPASRGSQPRSMPATRSARRSRPSSATRPALRRTGRASSSATGCFPIR